MFLRLCLIGCLAFITATAFAGELSLRAGQKKTVTFDDDIVEITLSREQVVEVNVGSDKRQLVVSAQNKGNVIINVRLRGGEQDVYTVTVTSGAATPDRLVAALTELRGIDGIDVKLSGEKVIVTGRIANNKVGGEFASVKQRYADLITDKTEKPYQDPDLIRDVANQTLSDKGLANYRVRNIGKILFLEGTPRSDSEKELVLKVVRLIDPFIEDGIRDNKGRLGETVAIDVMFLEVNRSAALDVGFAEANTNKRTQLGEFNYPERSMKVAGGPLTWTIAPFKMMLNMFQEKLYTKVLSNPKVIVRSGEKAEFHSGDELYFTYYDIRKEERTVLGTNQEVERRVTKVNSGVQLQVTPIVDALKQIDLTIALTVSDFVQDHDSGTPGATVSETKTAISLHDGYSALLTGFKGVRKRKTLARIPLLADIPIVGELFKSRKFEDQETEIMILLTVKTAGVSDDQKTLFNIVEKARVMPHDMVKLDGKASSEIEFSIFD